MQPTKTSREIVNEIAEANPGISYAEIGRMTNLTRERIRQIRGNKGPQICKNCGVVIIREQVGSTAYEYKLCGLHWQEEKVRLYNSKRTTLVCEVCSQDFQRYTWEVKLSESGDRPKMRWCSKKCQGYALAARTGIGRGSRANLQEFTCKTCNEKFWLTPGEINARKKQGGKPRYCSSNCNKGGLGMIRAPRVQRTCETCNKTFELKESYIEKNPTRGRFCSLSCSCKVSKGPRAPRTQKTCEVCGNSFEILESKAKRNPSWNRCCSVECRVLRSHKKHWKSHIKNEEAQV